ncbi:hypothetical protein DFJ75_1023 [Williamsia muralis]|uniref:Uncharacterized protein n=1 Tax=Williamsia marianensis TaxID=85044 RepID=A0A495K168_WILMA|nr:hypothetical protein DFJ75_1023 [Williamsia muralis]
MHPERAPRTAPDAQLDEPFATSSDHCSQSSPHSATVMRIPLGSLYSEAI